MRFKPGLKNSAYELAEEKNKVALLTVGEDTTGTSQHVWQWNNII